MAKKDQTTQVPDVETGIVEDAAQASLVTEESAAEVAVVKTKKELKKERKEIKKHKKEVKKEARRHSAKRTRAQNFFLVVLTLIVVVSMLFCSISAVKISMSIGKTAGDSAGDNAASTTSASAPVATPASTPSTPSTPSNTQEPSSDNSSEGGNSTSSNGAVDLSTTEGIVEYYKAAHAKVLSSATKANHTYNNTLNYNDTLDIGGNSTLAKVAKSLMNTFMKEETNKASYTGSDIAANFPGKNVQNLTADMLSQASYVEEGNNYVLTLKINSTEDAYDTGEKTGCLTDIINEKEVTDAAGSMVSLEGLENRYIGATVTATIDKTTGNMIAFDSDVPSYMCFSKATAAKFITVENCRIGLEYKQTWTIEY